MGAASGPARPVAKAKIPRCIAPTRCKLAALPDAHCDGEPGFLSCTIFPPRTNLEILHARKGQPNDCRIAN